MLKLLFEKYIFKPISFIFFVLIAAISAIEALPEKGESFLRFKITLAVWAIALLAYFIIVLIKNKYPTAPESSPGVLFIFHAETNELFEDIKYKIIENFNEVSTNFNIKLYPVCLNSKDIKNYRKNDRQITLHLLEKTGCMFCVDIVYLTEDSKTNDYLEIHINTSVLPSELENGKRKLLDHELKRISQPIKSIKFSKSQKLDTFRTTATHLNYVAKYIISVLFLLSDHYESAHMLLKDLYCNSSVKTALIDEAVKSAYFTSMQGIVCDKITEFKKSKDLGLLNEAEECLNEMNTLYANAYTYHLDMAYIQFCKYRDIQKAKEHVAACKTINANSEWLYSDAFLCAYAGDNDMAVVKKYELAQMANFNAVDIIDFIEYVAEKEPTRFRLHLALAMLYSHQQDNKLAAVHIKAFTDAHTVSPKDKYLLKIIEDIKKNKCYECMNEGCEECLESA